MSTDKRTIDWYNENAQIYTDHVRNPDDSIYHAYYEKPAMYKLLPDLHGTSVISLGCGPGEDSHYLKAQGATRSVGIDISQEEIKIAKASYPDCEFRVMDMEKLDFDEEEFDFAYSSLALSYIKDWDKLLKSVARILKPGSTFLFSCEHPIFTAMERRVENESVKIRTLQIKRDKLTGESTMQGDYLGEHPTPMGISEEVTTWHRSFSKISSDIQGSGFIIKQIIEPLPAERMKELKPATYQSLCRFPEFLILDLSKARDWAAHE